MSRNINEIFENYIEKFFLISENFEDYCGEFFDSLHKILRNVSEILKVNRKISKIISKNFVRFRETLWTFSSILKNF